MIVIRSCRSKKSGKLGRSQRRARKVVRDSRGKVRQCDKSPGGILEVGSGGGRQDGSRTATDVVRKDKSTGHKLRLAFAAVWAFIEGGVSGLPCDDGGVDPGLASRQGNRKVRQPQTCRKRGNPRRTMARVWPASTQRSVESHCLEGQRAE